MLGLRIIAEGTGKGGGGGVLNPFFTEQRAVACKNYMCVEQCRGWQVFRLSTYEKEIVTRENPVFRGSRKMQGCSSTQCTLSQNRHISKHRVVLLYALVCRCLPRPGSVN